MAAAGGNGPLAPHMRPFVPRHCVGLIEEDPSSKPIRFLLGLRGSMTQRDGGTMREVAKRGHNKRGTGAVREVTMQQPTAGAREAQ